LVTLTSKRKGPALFVLFVLFSRVTLHFLKPAVPTYCAGHYSSYTNAPQNLIKFKTSPLQPFDMLPAWLSVV